MEETSGSLQLMPDQRAASPASLDPVPGSDSYGRRGEGKPSNFLMYTIQISIDFCYFAAILRRAWCCPHSILMSFVLLVLLSCLNDYD